MEKIILERINDLHKISEIIKLYNLSAKRYLSQNFILDLNLNNKILKVSGDINNKNVIEIGPGPGALTRSILKTGPKKLIVIEKDPRFFDALSNLKKIVGKKRVRDNLAEERAIQQAEDIDDFASGGLAYLLGE